VVIDLREADIFVGKMAEFPYGRIDIGAAFGDGCQQFTESVLFDDIAPAWL